MTPEKRAIHAAYSAGSKPGGRVNPLALELLQKTRIDVVGLRALGRCRPVINLSISDALDPDPVLDPVEFHWTAAGPEALDGTGYRARQEAGRAYVARYLRAPSAEALQAFLPA